MGMEKSDKTPMYQYIINDIKRRIENGELQAHDPLPTQVELAKQFNTSEITSRRALADLVQEGYIYRIRGKGSFVKEEVAAPQRGAMRTIYLVYKNEAVASFNHPFFTEMFQGIREVCEENGIRFFLWGLDETYKLPDDLNAGIVLLTSNHAFDIRHLTGWQKEKRRMVTVHFFYPHLGIPYVIVDNLTGGYLATHHLISLGHREIGMILPGESMMDINQEFSLRLQGYRLALSQHQIPFNQDLIAVLPGEDFADTGYRGFKALMSLEHPPTAVFGASDLKAIGAMTAAKELGIRIPEDVSIMGYDDLAISEFTNPALSTVNQNTRKLGERAAEILLLGVKDEESGPLREEIVPTVIVRDSTAPLARDADA